MTTIVKRYLRHSLLAASVLIVFCIDLYIGHLTLKMRADGGIAMGLSFVELLGVIIVAPVTLIFFLLKPGRSLKILFAVLLLAFIGFLILN